MKINQQDDFEKNRMYSFLIFAKHVLFRLQKETSKTSRKQEFRR